jgi:Ca2+-binding EF-hand superfamily protein
LDEKDRKILGTVLFLAAVMTAQDQPHGGSARERRIEAGEKEAKRLVLLMDRDQNGKVSRQEFMTFMEGEFERLDVNKDGELDVKELMKSQVRVSNTVHRAR